MALGCPELQLRIAFRVQRDGQSSVVFGDRKPADDLGVAAIEAFGEPDHRPQQANGRAVFAGEVAEPFV
jgi:hypothetical protein